MLKFTEKNTKVIITCKFFDSLRLNRKYVRYTLGKQAVRDCISLDLNKEKIENAFIDTLKELGYTSIKIENIFIKKWYQFWEKDK
jgi:hypothetical protein